MSDDSDECYCQGGPEIFVRKAVVEERIRNLESAVRYLWDAWSEAEGGGQPEGWVFGPDAGMRAYYTEMGVAPSHDPSEFSEWREAPAEVQAVIRDVLDRSKQ